jgi:hypothetical protein
MSDLTDRNSGAVILATSGNRVIGFEICRQQSHSAVMADAQFGTPAAFQGCAFIRPAIRSATNAGEKRPDSAMILLMTPVMTRGRPDLKPR